MSLTTSSSTNELSLKAAQVAAIQRLLSFNDDSALTTDPNSMQQSSSLTSTNFDRQWKVLIYDSDCRNVLSPIISVQQLRRLGVTLYLLLQQNDREAIPDVPAIYFCRPTAENLAIIAKDCSKGLYSSAHLNFITKIERTVMEDFAKLVVQSNVLDKIASVHDQYLDFICYEKRLFTLSRTNSYSTINSSGTTEHMMETTMSDLSYGLFSVVATLGLIPIIRCPMGGAPEMVARKLCRLISEHPTLLQANKKSTSTAGLSGRPLLVILDRTSDLITPLQHCSTYQALIDDILNHKANRVEFEVVHDPDSRRPKKESKKYDLDPDDDPFFVQQKFQPFPEAIEQNGTELQEVTNREQAIRSKTVGSAPDSSAAGVGGASDLASAVDSLPALLERKKQLEVHTSILHAVMNEVAARDVPQFYELETTLAAGTYRNDPARAKKEVTALVADESKGTVNDKIRLTLVYALATNAKGTDIDEVMTALQQSVETAAAKDKTITAKLDIGMKAITYVKKLRSMNMLSSDNYLTQSATSASSGAQSLATPFLSTFMAKATTQATGFLAKATERVVASMMSGKANKHYATVVVENLFEMKNGTEDDTYLYLDPKVKKNGGEINVAHFQHHQGTGSNNQQSQYNYSSTPGPGGASSSSISYHRPPVKDVIVFMIGGGCYGEYQNLQLVSGGACKVCYGSTEMINPESFVQQLGQLGEQ